MINIEKAMKNLAKTMEENKQKFIELEKLFEKSEENIIDFIAQLDALESMKIQMVEDLEKEAKKYEDLKNEIKRKKLGSDFTDLSDGLKRHLKDNEIEEKAKFTVKRNTVKKNVDKRYDELKAELKELQNKNAKGELTETEVTRYYLIPELLKELNNVRI
jgi:hypothetical protein